MVRHGIGIGPVACQAPQAFGAGTHFPEHLAALFEQQPGTLDVAHQALTFRARAVFAGRRLAPPAGALRRLEQPGARQPFTQQVAVGNRRQVDGAPRLDGQPGEVGLLAGQRVTRRARLAK